MSSSRTIGGRLDLSALAALAGADRTCEHAPPLDRDTARVAARELRARGLTPRDIASHLQLSEGAVRELLGEPSLITNRR